MHLDTLLEASMKRKRGKRWNNPLEEKEEREMEAFIISFSK
jgi:hypothetical protein